MTSIAASNFNTALPPDFGWQETIKAPAITIPIHPHGPYFILICLSAFSTQG